jgi:hypothetical protein
MFSKETVEMSMVLDGGEDTRLTEDERIAVLRAAVQEWLDRHERTVRAFGNSRDLNCRLAGRRFAGHECFDCDFDVESGKSHSLTVSVCGANGFVDDDAEVVDAVSALTLIGMLLERLEIRPILIAR